MASIRPRRCSISLLILASILSGPVFAQAPDPSNAVAVTAPAAAPKADSTTGPDPFAQARTERSQARWILAYGVLFAAAVGFLVWRQEK